MKTAEELERSIALIRTQLQAERELLSSLGSKAPFHYYGHLIDWLNLLLGFKGWRYKLAKVLKKICYTQEWLYLCEKLFRKSDILSAEYFRLVRHIYINDELMQEMLRK